VQAKVDGLVLDIGVSSMQIDEAARGFSYTKDGALSMSMGGGRLDAAKIVNKYKEVQLADVLRRYGELRNSRALARKIVANRLVSSTLQLAKIAGQEYVSRVFQAIRIEVNDELSELSLALANADKVIKPGGRLVVVSFHSLEDRIVKKFFASEAVSRYSPAIAPTKPFQSSAKNAIIPSGAEVSSNPRAASAKLRFGIRV
jgi:16S rRNA (cytosine1402-N4)-methyltransferase